MTDWATKARDRFPSLKSTDQIYMDNAGGSQVLDVVIDGIKDYFTNTNVQLGATYGICQKSTNIVNEGLEAAARHINADPGEVVLGSSSTQLLANLSSALSFPSGSEIIISTADHETNIAPWIRLAERQNHTIKFWNPDPSQDYLLTTSTLQTLLSDKTVLVTFTNASNILGTIHDVPGIIDFIHEKHPKVLVAVDGVAYSPHRPVDVKVNKADFYILSWYKIYGPHISMLYASPRTKQFIKPLTHYFNPKETLYEKLNLAGGNYELTSVIPKITEFLTKETWEEISKHEEILQKILIEWLVSREDIIHYGTKETSANKRIPVISFSVKGRGSKEIVDVVERRSKTYGIRWGHFYSARLVEQVSGDLKEPEEGLIRVSLLFYNTVEEVRGLIELLEKILDGKD